MFEVFPASLSEIEDPSILDVVERIEVPISATPNDAPSTEDRPFIQLGYDEISQDDIDAVFGFCSISDNNMPIGVVGDFQEISFGTDKIVFSLQRLQSYLEDKFPQIVQQYFQCGSMDAYGDQIGEDMTANQYLIGGILECIGYCSRYALVLVIRW